MNAVYKSKEIYLYPSIGVADANLQEIKSIRFLGLNFYADMKWKVYIVTSAAKKVIQCVVLDKFFLQLYKFIIVACIDYGCFIWSGDSVICLEILVKFRICSFIDSELIS